MMASVKLCIKCIPFHHIFMNDLITLLYFTEKNLSIVYTELVIA